MVLGYLPRNRYGLGFAFTPLQAKYEGEADAAKAASAAAAKTAIAQARFKAGTAKQEEAGRTARSLAQRQVSWIPIVAISSVLVVGAVVIGVVAARKRKS